MLILGLVNTAGYLFFYLKRISNAGNQFSLNRFDSLAINR